jgi:T-complex protein 1 subunit alpha
MQKNQNMYNQRDFFQLPSGTTSVVIIAAELLRKANELVKCHIHPTNVISGYKMAMKESIK